MRRPIAVTLVGVLALALSRASRTPPPSPASHLFAAPAASTALESMHAPLGHVGIGLWGGRGAEAFWAGRDHEGASTAPWPSVGHPTAPSTLPPLLPLTRSTVATLLLAAVALAVAAAGGIGGGGVLVPLYLLALRAPPRDAVALSNATILGGALASLAFNARRRTAAGSPVIDWDVVLAMEPTTVCGAVAGAIANKVVPGWLTTAALTLLLAAMTVKLAGRARGLHSEENGARLDEHQSLLAAEGGTNDARREAGQGLRAAEGGATVPKPPAEPRPLAGVPDAPPAATLPMAKVSALAGLCAIVAASDGAKGAVRCGSPLYWAASLAVLPPALWLAWRTRNRLLAEAAGEGGGSSPCGHVRWTPHTTALFPALSTLAGAVAGLFGVGGGIIKAPLMLELGVPPDVAAATSGQGGGRKRDDGARARSPLRPPSPPPLSQSP